MLYYQAACGEIAEHSLPGDPTNVDATDTLRLAQAWLDEVDAENADCPPSRSPRSFPAGAPSGPGGHPGTGGKSWCVEAYPGSGHRHRHPPRRLARGVPPR